LDENDRYELLNSVYEKSVDENTTTTHYLLLLTGYDENKNKITHVMYIKDLESFMKLHVCPKCGYILNMDVISKDHVKNCNGKIEKKLCLEEQSIPFIPHLFKNHLYSFLLAHNRKSKYQVIRNYITYDFETVMRKKNVKITEKTTCYAEQLPLSVSYYVKGKKFNFSKFVYKGKDENETFINNWLESMFKDAGRIYRDEYVY
jgi:hypothetical protein